ncbi:hypothetical protein HMI55_002869 [Coelomomyces lativittatus]|nr:hypothetical protein HMI55_002869 [Coelomomyces lativittatus]
MQSELIHGDGWGIEEERRVGGETEGDPEGKRGGGGGGGGGGDDDNREAGLCKVFDLGPRSIEAWLILAEIEDDDVYENFVSARLFRLRMLDIKEGYEKPFTLLDPILATVLMEDEGTRRLGMISKAV